MTGQLMEYALLALAADILEDAERNRISNENRLRELTSSRVDPDGVERGFGLDQSHPDVARLAALVDMLAKVEHQAELNLAHIMREHSLGSWVKAQRGVGEKQAARLLSKIGDPYWNTLHDRPRTVSELWAFCGLHTLPASQEITDNQWGSAGGDSISAGGDQYSIDNQREAVAARRIKGQRANWSSVAKARTWLISTSMLKAGNREAYDHRRAATTERVHTHPCPPCGPAGKPAQPGSPWSLAHQHADALRVQGKEFLKELWRAARELHPDSPVGQAGPDIHPSFAGGGPDLEAGAA